MGSWIVKRAGILGGKPYVRGTRLTVEFIRQRIADGASGEDLLKAYPQLTREGLDAARSYVAQVMNRGILRPSQAGRRLARHRREPFPLADDIYSGGDR